MQTVRTTNEKKNTKKITQKKQTAEKQQNAYRQTDKTDRTQLEKSGKSYFRFRQI